MQEAVWSYHGTYIHGNSGDLHLSWKSAQLSAVPFVQAFIVFVAILDPVTFFIVEVHTWAGIRVRNEGAATSKSPA